MVVARRRCLLFDLRANDSLDCAVDLGGCSGYHVAAFSVDLDFSFWSQPSAVRSGQKASTCAKLRFVKTFLGVGAFLCLNGWWQDLVLVGANSCDIS